MWVDILSLGAWSLKQWEHGLRFQHKADEQQKIIISGERVGRELKAVQEWSESSKQ